MADGSYEAIWCTDENRAVFSLAENLECSLGFGWLAGRLERRSRSRDRDVRGAGQTRWASQGRPRELNTNDIDPSIHPSVTDLTSLQLPILCLTWRQRGLRGNLIQQRRNPRVLLSFLIPGGNSGKHKEQRGGLSTNLKQSLKNKWIYLKEQKKNQKKNRLVRPRKIFRNFFL